MARRSATGLGAALLLLLLAVALPFNGWTGLGTEGCTLALIAGSALLVAPGRLRRYLAAGAAALGVVSDVLIAHRLGDPSEAARASGALAIGLAGAVLVTLVALVETISARPPPGAAARLRSGPARFVADDERRASLRFAWRSLWTSRLLAWTAGVFGVLRLGPAASPQHSPIELPFGYLGNLLTAPATAWDAGPYLSIAQFGYAGGHYFDAFFPVYPVAVRLGAWSPKATVISGIVVSVAALMVALYLLHRLVVLELGAEAADLTVLFVAFFPMAFFFSAVYSESMFLALTVGAFYAARRGWWARAGVAGALAAGTRVTGLLVIVPLLVLYLWGPREQGIASDRPPGKLRPRYPVRGDLAFLALVPLGAVAYLAYHGVRGDWLATIHAAQHYWHREFSPGLGVLRGVRDFVRSVHQIILGPTGHVLPTSSFQQLADPLKLAAVNVTDFSFLVLACVTTFGALRRLPAAYGLYALASVAVLVSTVSPHEPLQSFPRYLAVVFPCQIWIAVWARDRPGRRVALLLSAGAMALFASQYARLEWVA